jgi:hypothetical protein
LPEAQFDGGEFIFPRFFDPVSDGAEDSESAKKEKESIGEVHLEFEGGVGEGRHKLFIRGADVFQWDRSFRERIGEGELTESRPLVPLPDFITRLEPPVTRRWS